MFKTGKDLIAEAKGRVRQVTVDEVQTLQSEGVPVVYLDVREPNEWNMGHLPEALHIPRGKLEGTVESRVPRNAKVVIYCAHGNRSALAADTLQQMGYQDVASMAGGIHEWMDAGGMLDN